MYKLKMFERLIFLAKKAVADKSHFLVASIVIDKEGNEYSGINVEYEIPTNSICAERNAISTAFSNGVRMGDIKEVHVLAINMNKQDENYIVTPCGACRQAILEASNQEAKVFMYNTKGEVKETAISDLLPGAFAGVEK